MQIQLFTFFNVRMTFPTSHDGKQLLIIINILFIVINKYNKIVEFNEKN